MNEYQRRAYDERPLIDDGAPDAESGYYRHRETRRGVDVTVMVTVDVGEGEARRFGSDAVWHVSVSCRPPPGARRPLPVSRWKPRHRDAALAAPGDNAEGVGQHGAEGFLEFGEYPAHLYRPLSDREREGLSASRRG
jgi:hypothetical protein